MRKIFALVAVILILSKHTEAQTTYTWTGLSNTAWDNAANWTGGGYPNASTDNAIINSGPNMPLIATGVAISVSQLTVGAAASLTMAGTANLSVYDAVTFSGTASFASTSTFTYASSVNDQNILNLAYGNLAISGTALKFFQLVPVSREILP
jgi:hypothetical protein